MSTTEKRTRQDRIKQWVMDWIRPLVWNAESYVGRKSLVGDHPFHDTDDFPWVEDVEAEWTTIRDELDDILQYRDVLPNFQDISEDLKSIQQDDQWKTFFLYGFGEKAEENCALVPETTRIIESIPGMSTAFFSILAPGKHIPAHRGPYKGVLRYHLGLKVPEPADQCRIRVDDQVRHWNEGESLIFDDTYNHEVWNDTDGERAILFLDVERPLPQPLSTLNRLIIRLIGKSPFVEQAKDNQEVWNERLRKARQRDAAASNGVPVNGPETQRAS